MKRLRYLTFLLPLAFLACASGSHTASPPTPGHTVYVQQPATLGPAEASDPSCEVEIRTLATATPRGTYELTTTLTNRTARSLKLSWTARCPGPGVVYEGLVPGYDYGATCTAGACPGGPFQPRTVSLPAHGAAVAAQVTVTPSGDACNRELSPATYHVSASLILDGVRSCLSGYATIAVTSQPAPPATSPPTVSPRPVPSPTSPATRPRPAPSEEPCPAMGCAYEPCPPGVSPPTGCAAVCGCAGMPRTEWLQPPTAPRPSP